VKQAEFFDEDEFMSIELIEHHYPKGRVVVREVGLRDGLQMAQVFPTTEQKKRWISLEYSAGVRHFEAGSFLPVSRFPQFADVGEIVRHIQSLPGATAIALVVNECGISEAFAAGVDELTLVLSATEEHNQANTRRSREASLEAIGHAVKQRDQTSRQTLLNVIISMSFGCSIAGTVDSDEVLRLARECLKLGVDTVGIADTVGYAGPTQVKALCQQMAALMGERPYTVHLHNTRGTGLANAAAALEAGARIFDASLAGLGGCPFAPGATGNVVIEDLLFMFETMGISTGVDIARLVEVRRVISETMPDQPLHGGVAQAGLPKNFRPQV